MHFRKLVAAVALSVALAFGASAQTAPDAGTPGTAAPAQKKSTSKKPTTSKKSTVKKSAPKKAKKGKKPAPAPVPPKGGVDEETRKALESLSQPAPAPAPPPATEPAPAPPPPVAETGPADDQPPVLQHTPVTAAKKGKPLTVTAHAEDASGVFGPVLYLRKRGMPVTDYIPIRMGAVRTGAPGDYAAEIPAPLISVESLEYYIEVWDNAGNGPVRAGSPEAPLPIKVEEEKIIVKAAPPPPPTKVEIKPKGAPPAITHGAVTQAAKGKPIEINARLVGDTGVQGATVMFRHVGEKDYKALPMGNIGGNDYTATIPAGMAGADIEYYLEAFDRYGNGPGRSGAPNVPYLIKVSEPRPVPVAAAGPRMVKAPFQANPGRAAGWLMIGGFVGGLIFAGGEAYASMQANDAYTHTFTYEGRLRPDLLNRANTYGDRAKIAAIVSGSALVVGIVLLVVFPEHPDTLMVGSGGDIGVRF